jgi:hypothetical protein
MLIGRWQLKGNREDKTPYKIIVLLIVILLLNINQDLERGYLTPTSFLCVANEWLCKIDKGLVNAVLFHDKEGFWYNRSWDSFYEAKILWASIFIADEMILK